jgi:hypothetical protein
MGVGVSRAHILHSSLLPAQKCQWSAHKQAIEQYMAQMEVTALARSESTKHQPSHYSSNNPEPETEEIDVVCSSANNNEIEEMKKIPIATSQPSAAQHSFFHYKKTAIVRRNNNNNNLNLIYSAAIDVSGLLLLAKVYRYYIFLRCVDSHCISFDKRDWIVIRDAGLFCNFA